MFKSTNKKGTTLVEVLVASIILSIVIGSTLFFIAFSQSTLGNADTEATASFIIKDWFESFKKIDKLDNVQAITDHTGESNAEVYFIDSVKYKLYFETTKVRLDTTPVSPTNPELTKLTANVKWKINNKDKHLVMSMLSNK